MNVSRFSLAAPLVLAFAALACSGETPQPRPAGTLKIVTKGGAASNGSGGGGGLVRIDGNGGGPLKVLQAGSVDPTFTFDTAKPALGANPKTISASATLTATDPLNGDDGATPATGLWVKPGVILTLTPPAGTTSVLSLSDGVFVEGTILTTRDAAGTSHNINIGIGGGNFVVTSAGVIDLSGADGGAAPGGDGGAFLVSSWGNIANAGTFKANGGSGSPGGAGGVFSLSGQYSDAFSSGAVTVSGGSSTAGPGGPGGAIFLSTAVGDVGSSGALTATGGSGSAGGGDGGDVQLTSIFGSALSSSAIDTSGGTVSTGGTGPGGTAGTIAIFAGARNLLVTGSLKATGGAGVGAQGGGGNTVSLSRNGGPIPLSGSLRLAADIDTSGGAGTAGGTGRSVTISAGIPIFVPGKEDTSLLGYAAIDTSGGASTAGGNGGTAGSVGIVQNTTTPAGSTSARTDDVYNEVPITARGGDATAGNGGGGNQVGIMGDTSVAGPVTRSTVNVADIDASGGAGSGRGGSGGRFNLYAGYKASNTGKVSLSGGNGGTGPGGTGGMVDFEVYHGPLENLGEVKASGGTATAGPGGSGGRFFAYGSQVTAAQNYTADGGGSSTAAGGNGGDMQLVSDQNATIFSGTASVKAGVGAPAALPVPVVGSILIDGVNESLTNGQYTK